MQRNAKGAKECKGVQRSAKDAKECKVVQRSAQERPRPFKEATSKRDLVGKYTVVHRSAKECKGVHRSAKE